MRDRRWIETRSAQGALHECSTNARRMLDECSRAFDEALATNSILEGNAMCEAIDVLELIDETPPRWDGPHVGRRLMEAMRTLRMLPMPGVTGYRPAWPAYAYEFEDLLAQHEQGELERTQQQQNRTR